MMILWISSRIYKNFCWSSNREDVGLGKIFDWPLCKLSASFLSGARLVWEKSHKCWKMDPCARATVTGAHLRTNPQWKPVYGITGWMPPEFSYDSMIEPLPSTQNIGSLLLAPTRRSADYASYTKTFDSARYSVKPTLEATLGESVTPSSTELEPSKTFRRLAGIHKRKNFKLLHEDGGQPSTFFC